MILGVSMALRQELFDVVLIFLNFVDAVWGFYLKLCSTCRY